MDAAIHGVQRMFELELQLAMLEFTDFMINRFANHD